MKKTLSFVLALALVLAFSGAAFAVVTPANGMNTSPDTAQTILRNAQTMAQFRAADNSQQQVVSGTLNSTADEHWYRITLPANPQTVLSINCFDVQADVYDANLNLVFQQRFLKGSTIGAVPFFVNIPVAGTHFIRLYNAPGGNSYLMTMGEPGYENGTLTLAAPTVTLTTTTSSAQTSINLLGNATLPRGAVVVSVYLSGTKTGSVSSEKRYLRYAGETAWTTANASYTVDYSVAQNRQLASLWTIRWDGTVKANATWAPSVKFYYTIPVLPQ